MAKKIKSTMSMILEELPEEDKKAFSGGDLKAYFHERYGSPQIINSPPVIESVFQVEGKKIGIIEDIERNIIGCATYRGDIPDAFIQERPAPTPCKNGYTRRITVTTVSPTIPVSVLTWIFGRGPLVIALAAANLVSHSSNVAAAKTTSCAACAWPCTCVATTVAGAAGVVIAPIRKWGIPVSATAVHVINTTITASCS